ncbi:Bestrophin homolog, partial [Gryllus bimaculatus]
GLLWSYDWVSIPLVYTQVVTIATYSFFLAALVGRQYVDAAKKPLQMEIDIYLPVFTILQFFFFMGLLKVAEQLINPFGDDDEDFELNWLIDRHTKVSYLGVDILMSSAPPLVKDMYFDQVDLTLPYTEASVAYKKKTYRGSVHNMTVPEDKHTMFLPEISEEDEDRTPTPRSSLSNVQHLAHSRPTEPAPVTAAAAGTWRSSFPSTQSFNKAVEVDPEFETSRTSTHNVEMCMDTAAFQQEQKIKTVIDTLASGSGREGISGRPLSRSESVPAKKPIFVAKSMLGWPSSSTLGRSDVSFRNSEQSIEMQSCYNSSLNFGASADRTPEEERSCDPFVQAPVRRSRGDSFSSGVSRGGGNEGAVGRCGGVGGEGAGGSDDSDGDRIGISRREIRERLATARDCFSSESAVGEIGGVNTPAIQNNRLSLSLDVTCNYSSHLSHLSLDTPSIPKQYEHYLCKPKEETEYVTFKKDFRSVCMAKVKSCPKLILVKRQHSANNGRKKGVRWKPMVNNVPGRDVGSLRRQTVEILPMTPDPSNVNYFFPSKTALEEIEFLSQSNPDTQCLWCRKQMEYRQALLRRTVSGDSEHFVNTSADSGSNLSFSQELCPLHYRIKNNESRKGCPVPPNRLDIGTEDLHPKSLPFQERRATVSTLSLTGSELEAKRWQSRSFWERGFFKKMKLLYNRKGVKATPAVVKRTSLFISNKTSLSQSLPNIAFSHCQSDSLGATSEKLTPIFLNRMTPTVRISDMTSAESEGSSCFASIMEMQEEDELDKKDLSTKVVDDAKKIPKISLNLPVSSPECSSNSVMLVANSSSEHLNTRSQDSSWQSADWTGIIDIDQKHDSVPGENLQQTSTPKEVHSVSSSEEANTCASNTLQEVIVVSGNGSPCNEKSSKSIS